MSTTTKILPSHIKISDLKLKIVEQEKIILRVSRKKGEVGESRTYLVMWKATKIKGTTSSMRTINNKSLKLSITINPHTETKILMKVSFSTISSKNKIDVLISDSQCFSIS